MKQKTLSSLLKRSMSLCRLSTLVLPSSLMYVYPWILRNACNAEAEEDLVKRCRHPSCQHDLTYLKYVEHLAHLGKDEHAVPASFKLAEKLCQYLKLPSVKLD